VKETQSLIVQQLPNVLLLNRQQFDMVRPDADLEPTDELLWKTIDPLTKDIINVMDIHVKGVFEPKPVLFLT
jgi:hypothetical protein